MTRRVPLCWSLPGSAYRFCRLRWGDDGDQVGAHCGCPSLARADLPWAFARRWPGARHDCVRSDHHDHRVQTNAARGPGQARFLEPPGWHHWPAPLQSRRPSLRPSACLQHQNVRVVPVVGARHGRLGPRDHPVLHGLCGLPPCGLRREAHSGGRHPCPGVRHAFLPCRQAFRIWVAELRRALVQSLAQG